MTHDIDNNKIFARVRSVVSEVLNVPPEKVTKDATFISDLGAESLDLVTIITEFEDVFDTEISDEDLETFQTVGDAVVYIQKLLSADKGVA